MGLMSGTSGDGVDASVISSDGISDYNEVINKYFKYDQKMCENLHNLRSKIFKFDDLKKNENCYDGGHFSSKFWKFLSKWHQF